jgi:hypothetical protein
MTTAVAANHGSGVSVQESQAVAMMVIAMIEIGNRPAISSVTSSP